MDNESTNQHTVYYKPTEPLSFTANCVVDGGTGCFEGATRYRSKSCGGDCPGTKKKWRQNIPFERHKFLSNNLSAKEHSRRLIERENIKVEKTKECNMS